MPEIGKIYERSEAEKLYGEVFSSYPLTKIKFIEVINVELRRNDVLTISNETFVLEDSVPCPPNCYNS